MYPLFVIYPSIFITTHSKKLNLHTSNSWLITGKTNKSHGIRLQVLISAHRKSCSHDSCTMSSQSLHWQEPLPHLHRPGPDMLHGPTCMCAHTHTQENTHCSHTLYLHQGFIQTLSSEMCVCVTCHTADTAWWVHHACTVSDTGDSILDCHMVHNDCSYPANHSAPQERRSHTGYTSHTWRQHRHTIREESPETGIHCWQRKTTLPLALPGSFRYCVKGWVQTVGVVTDVTVIT